MKVLGDYSKKLKDNVSEYMGNKVCIDGPFGKFTVAQPGNPLLCIAGGIGITPFISILRDYKIVSANKNSFLDNKSAPGPSEHEQVLLYWMRSPKDSSIFAKELTALEKNKEFKIERFSRTEKKPLNKKVFESIKDLHNRDIFICCSSDQTKRVMQILSSLGIPRRHINYELFSM